MKLKIAGLFRSLLGQNGNSEPARSVSSAHPPAVPPPLPGAPEAAPAAPAPAYPAHHTPAAAPQMRAPVPTAQSPNHVGISLVAIVNSLPLDLKAKMIETPAPGQMVYLHVDNIVAQLAFGAVKITFGELRHFAPTTFANAANSVYDNRSISLPLNEILARINPALLSRRPATQKFEVSEEIAGPFGGSMGGVTFSAQPLKGAPVPAAPVRAMTPAAPAAPILPSVPPREIAPVIPSAPISFTPPKPSAPAAPVAPITPISPITPMAPPVPAPEPAPLKSEPIAFNPRQTIPTTAPVPFAEPARPAANGAGGHGNHVGTNGANGINGNNGKAAPALPAFKFTTTTPVPPAPASSESPEEQPVLSIQLKELAESWPNEVKSEMVKTGFINAIVPLPASAIEPGLKRGRVTMIWRDLRTAIKPHSDPSPCDDLELELSLKVIAPAFLAVQKQMTARQKYKVAVSEEIPNLFFGFPQPETPVAPPTPKFQPSPLPANPATATTSTIPATQNPQNPKILGLQNASRVADTNLLFPNAQPETPSSDSNLFQRAPAPATDFLSRQMQPKDVVAHAMTLPGVAGAVVALADGLRVASEVPADFNADTVAAFLPQIFERVNQSTRELRMGSLNNVSFTVGSTPWKIFRINSIYFAAFGRGGETFPKAQLAQLAAGLDRKTK